MNGDERDTVVEKFVDAERQSRVKRASPLHGLLNEDVPGKVEPHHEAHTTTKDYDELSGQRRKKREEE